MACITKNVLSQKKKEGLDNLRPGNRIQNEAVVLGIK